MHKPQNAHDYWTAWDSPTIGLSDLRRIALKRRQILDVQVACLRPSGIRLILTSNTRESELPFLPRDAMLARYAVWCGPLCPSFCLSHGHKSVFYQNI